MCAKSSDSDVRSVTLSDLREMRVEERRVPADSSRFSNENSLNCMLRNETGRAGGMVRNVRRAASVIIDVAPAKMIHRSRHLHIQSEVKLSTM